jgi:uncharacterized membrane protein YesL
MIGKTSQRVFVQVYVVILLNLFFWVFTLSGGVILGVGPALRAISELYLDSQSDYQNVKFKTGWRYFKKYFWVANGNFWSFAGIFAVLAYNLFLSAQLTGLWVLLVQFILFFALAGTLATGGYTLLLLSRFEVTTMNAVKLALGQLFQNFPQFLMSIAGLAAIGVATYFWPGLLIFVTVAAAIMWLNHCGKRWYAYINTLLLGGH